MKTCDDVRDRLPLYLTGDLPEAESEAVRVHLADCPTCLADRAELEDMWRRLDAVSVPMVPAVDVSAIYAAALERQARSARRWRAAAGLGAAVAAGLLLAAVLPRLEVKLGGNELVVRWGPADPPAPSVAPPAPLPPTTDPEVLARLDALDARAKELAAREARWDDLQDLLLTLAADVDERDRKRRDDYDAVLAEVHRFESATREQFRRTEQTSTALYTLITEKPRPEGGKP